jgi:hypothetical protein
VSYDILFVRTGDVVDKLAAARQIVDADEDEESGPRPSREADERRRLLIADLLKIHPSMRFEPSEDGEAYGGWIGSDDDDCPFPTIELDIDGGMIAISYSADPDVLSAISPIVESFARHGYVAYDPQIDQLIGQSDTAVLQSKFSQTYAAAVNLVQDQGETVIRPAMPKPWWKLW